MENKKKIPLFAAVLLALCVSFMPSVSVYAETSESVKAVPVLVVEGNTIYVDAAESGWNSLQGTLRFDPANEVEEYGQTEGFVTAVAEQRIMGFQASNVTEDGEFIFAAAYTATSGEGLEYEDHIFYITFADTSTPVEITLYDEYNYRMLTAAVDGSPEAVTYAADEETLQANAAQHEEDKAANAGSDANTNANTDTEANEDAAAEEDSGSSRNVLPIVIVIAVLVLAVVAVVVSKKNSGHEEAEAPDAENDTDEEDADEGED